MTRADAQDVATLPKVELHVHLEGTITAATAIELARRHGEDPADVLPLVDGRYPERFDDFMQFVRLYLAVSRQLRTPEDLATIAADFAKRQVEQHVRYSEVTFTALTHVRNGMEPAAMWQAVREGFAVGGGDATVTRLIIDAVRDQGPEHADRTIELVADADAPIVAFGLAGIEGALPAKEFVQLRTAADELRLGLAVHAGETGPPDAVREALDDLGADRIGHGIAAAQDPALIDRLVSEHVTLEVCPSSNVALGIVPTLEEHPLPHLMRAGVNVTVNSDDPPFFGTTLTSELEHATRLAEMSVADLADLQRRAARAAFAPAAVVASLVAEIDAWERDHIDG